MKNTEWKQLHLFGEGASVIIEASFGMMQESGTIGFWVKVFRVPAREVVYERIVWLNYSENGIASGLESIWQSIAETVEYHGLEMPEMVIDRTGAPF